MNNSLIIRYSGSEKFRHKHFLGLGTIVDTAMMAMKQVHAQNSRGFGKQNIFFFPDPGVARSEGVCSLTGFISVFSGLVEAKETQNPKCQFLSPPPCLCWYNPNDCRNVSQSCIQSRENWKCPTFYLKQTAVIISLYSTCPSPRVTQWKSWGGHSQTFPSHTSFPSHLAPWVVYIFIHSQLSKYIWINCIFLCTRLYLSHWSVVPCPRQGC